MFVEYNTHMTAVGLSLPMEREAKEKFSRIDSSALLPSKRSGKKRDIIPKAQVKSRSRGDED